MELYEIKFLTLFFVNWNCVLFLILHIPNIHSLTSRLKNLSSSIQNPRSSCMAQFVTNAFFLFAAFVYSVKQQYLLCAIFLRLFTVCILFLLSIFIYFSLHPYILYICIISHRKCCVQLGVCSLEDYATTYNIYPRPQSTSLLSNIISVWLDRGWEIFTNKVTIHFILLFFIPLHIWRRKKEQCLRKGLRMVKSKSTEFSDNSHFILLCVFILTQHEM